MASFYEVYEEYAKSVHRFLLALTGNEDWAEELLQETFYQALQHIDKFEGRCSLYTWLCQIGKNAWYKECRRKRKFSEADWDDLVLLAKEPSVESQVIAKQEYANMRRAIQKLEEPYRDVLVLHIYGGIKLGEIAAIYGKSESWAKVTYFRAKQKIIQEVSR